MEYQKAEGGLKMELEEGLERCQRVYAQVDLDAIAWNVQKIKDNLNPGTGIMAVVKADGYGHGSAAVAGRLETLPFLAGFGVATAEEAHALRRAGIRKPILVLGYTFPCSYEMLAREEIRTAVFRPDCVEQLGEAGKRAGKPVKVHIKVETGMNRIGIAPDESGLRFVKGLMEQEGIEIEGIFTHFARADEADKTNAREALETFRKFLHMIKGELSLEIPVKHCANSAAALELPQAQLDMVRAGIAMYGLYPSEETEGKDAGLRTALSLYSHIVYIKTVAPGEAIGYGGTFTAGKYMRIATIPVGYGDGYPRSLSNRGFCLLHGRRVPIVGRICMDQFMADVTDVPEAAEGDRVVLLGRDGGEEIDAKQLGELSGRFYYELLCNLGKRIPRIYR